ncbi:MAG: hypothetical protein AAFP19_13460 [Bacteroidota bacterium]
MTKFPTIWIILLLCCAACKPSTQRHLQNTQFQAINPSPKYLRTNSISFSDGHFEYRIDAKVMGGNTAPLIKAYSGTYEILGDTIQLTIEQLLCCVQAIETLAEIKEKKDRDEVYGSRYVNCEYRNYPPSYLRSVAFDYERFCEVSFIVEKVSRGIQLLGREEKYVK